MNNFRKSAYHTISLPLLFRKGGEEQVQIIGMSATLPNLDLLAKWLKADLYKTDYRPVPLSEHIKINEEIFDSKFKWVRNLNPLVKIPGDCDDLVYLCLETVIYGHSVLIFCPTKNWCEKMAKNVAKEFFNLATSTEKDHNKAFVRTKIRENIQEGPIKDALEHLKRCPAGLVILTLINVNIYQNSFIFDSLSF